MREVGRRCSVTMLSLRVTMRVGRLFAPIKIKRIRMIVICIELDLYVFSVGLDCFFIDRKVVAP